MPQTATPIRPPGGRGRGGDVNRPAWMSNGPVAAGATTAVGAAEEGAAAEEMRATALTSAVAAGRGRGRGAGINIPAWMANGGDGPRAAQAATGAEAKAALGAATGATAGAAEGAAHAVARVPSGPRPHPDNWESLTKAQRESWKKNAQKVAKGKRR